MELLSVIKARSLWLLDLTELNPHGKSIDIIEWLKDSYSFSKIPSSLQDLDEFKSLAFLNGKFKTNKGIFIEVDLRIYSDGLVADTRSSTADTDLFFEDVLKSAVEKLGLVHRPDMIIRKSYLSEVNVLSRNSLDDLNPKLKSIASKISSLLGIKETSPYGVFAVALSNNLSIPMAPTYFKFERKINLPFSEHRYYSIAPLKTEDHLSVLDDLEKLMISD